MRYHCGLTLACRRNAILPEVWVMVRNIILARWGRLAVGIVIVGLFLSLMVPASWAGERRGG